RGEMVEMGRPESWEKVGRAEATTLSRLKLFKSGMTIAANAYKSTLGLVINLDTYYPPETSNRGKSGRPDNAPNLIHSLTWAKHIMQNKKRQLTEIEMRQRYLPTERHMRQNG
ncbi:16983_t:CDS:2, partial [Acaulospora colombiana]